MPIIRDQVRPFVRTARPYIRNLQPAAENLAQGKPGPARSLLRAQPPLQHARRTTRAAHEELDTRRPPRRTREPPARRGLPVLARAGWPRTPPRSCRTGDAHGPFRRFTVSASCTTLRGLVQDEPALELLLGVTELLNDPGLCPAELMQKQAPTLGRVMAMVLFALSCFGILLYLWVSFGGLDAAQADRATASRSQMPESALLVNEARRAHGRPRRRPGEGQVARDDGRPDGRDRDGREVRADPVGQPRDPAAEVAARPDLHRDHAGHRRTRPTSRTAASSRTSQVQETVDFDEVISTFDKPTRDNFRAGSRSSRRRSTTAAART